MRLLRKIYSYTDAEKKSIKDAGNRQKRNNTITGLSATAAPVGLLGGSIYSAEKGRKKALIRDIHTETKIIDDLIEFEKESARSGAAFKKRMAEHSGRMERVNNIRKGLPPETGVSDIYKNAKKEIIKDLEKARSNINIGKAERLSNKEKLVKKAKSIKPLKTAAKVVVPLAVVGTAATLASRGSSQKQGEKREKYRIQTKHRREN